MACHRVRRPAHVPLMSLPGMRDRTVRIGSAVRLSRSPLKVRLQRRREHFSTQSPRPNRHSRFTRRRTCKWRLLWASTRTTPIIAVSRLS